MTSSVFHTAMTKKRRIKSPVKQGAAPAGRSTSCRELAAELLRQMAKQTGLASWNSGGRPDMKYVKLQELTYVEYKCSRLRVLCNTSSAI